MSGRPAPGSISSTSWPSATYASYSACHCRTASDVSVGSSGCIQGLIEYDTVKCSGRHIRYRRLCATRVRGAGVDSVSCVDTGAPRDGTVADAVLGPGGATERLRTSTPGFHSATATPPIIIGMPLAVRDRRSD